ncbi:hypothetical protein [Neisseria bacilliformis]|uniref:hypothetical protein n=1 Tax=Neisseria bacilliformis TaxID=267212 RepID=UPI0039C939E4
MSGGDGNDVYHVDNVNDTVTERSAEGTDTIYSSVSYTAAANVENLTSIGRDLCKIPQNPLNSHQDIQGISHEHLLPANRPSHDCQTHRPLPTIEVGSGD